MSINTNCRFRIMENNFAELTTNDLMKSSELAAFPVSNLTNKFRSKLFKPSGYFKIDSTNNKVYVNDGGAKTATLTTGDYTTPDLLATEIQTQLNSVSSGWTVNYNESAGEYKFKFSHASAHTISISNQTNAVWDTIGFVGTLDQVAPFTAFEQRNHTEEWIVWDTNANNVLEFFAIIGPLGEEFPLSDTATIKLQANNMNNWSSPPIDITLSKTPGGIFRFFDDIADSGYRFWRFYYQDKLNPLGPEGVSFGHAYLGDYIQFETRNFDNGFEHKVQDDSLRSESESGVLYFDTKTKYSTLRGVNVQFLNRANKEILEQFFFDYGLTTPFYISLDPRLSISDSLDIYTKYVVVDEVPAFRHIIGDKFSVEFLLREVI